jgi:membrane protein implicated in regulation of membrane protease activity
MTTVYAICAVVGGVIFLVQFLMSIVGAGGAEADFGSGGTDQFDLTHGIDSAHHGADPSQFFGILTFKTIVAALAFFGLAGLAANAAGFTTGVTLAIAFASGVAAMFVVAALMRALLSLQEEGTEQIRNAIGQTGTVYLTIPGKKEGFGKVTLDIQSRTAEYQAVTFQDKLPTGSKIVVVDVIGPDTVEVIAAPETGRVFHE